VEKAKGDRETSKTAFQDTFLEELASCNLHPSKLDRFVGCKDIFLCSRATSGVSPEKKMLALGRWIITTLFISFSIFSSSKPPPTGVDARDRVS
jgi:hypothetical protein